MLRSPFTNHMTKHLMRRSLFSFALPIGLLAANPCLGQDGNNTGAAPGDRMIEAYLRAETEKIETNFPGDFRTLSEWTQALPQLRQQYFYMLGLWPMPTREPLHATITRTLDRGEY